MKRVLEVRGADAVNTPMTLALPALWTGILYDREARTAARKLVTGSFEELAQFQGAVAREGLKARLGKSTARDLADELVGIAAKALKSRNPSDRDLLVPLFEVLESGTTPSEILADVAGKSNYDRQAILAALRL